MSKYSISTELIHAQQWARRSRKRVGSVACSEQGWESEIIVSEPQVRINRVRLKCILKDETQWGVKTHPVSHDDLGDTSAVVKTSRSGFNKRHCRRAMNDMVNGVQSRPNHDTSSHSVNTGSPKLAESVNTCLYGDGVPILPKSQPVMGMTVGNQTGSENLYKSSAMMNESKFFRGKVEQFLFPPNNRKEDC